LLNRCRHYHLFASILTPSQVAVPAADTAENGRYWPGSRGSKVAVKVAVKVARSVSPSPS
jgi:hypothetical protein